MKKGKLFFVALSVTILVLIQSAMVSAAPPLDEADFIAGAVDRVTLTTDPNTGVATVEIVLTDDEGQSHTVVVGEQTAGDLGLLWYDEDGNPQLLAAIPSFLEIPLAAILPIEDGARHPVGSALAAFFSDLPGVDYELIMAAHDDGYGFGVIAQALWLTQKLEGDADTLAAVLEAKKTGDFSAFTLEDGSIPANWGQFKKAVMSRDGKDNLGAVMSGRDKDNKNPGGHGNGSSKDKDKHGNNGNHGNNNDKDNKGKNKP